VRWRPASAREDRGAREARQQGSARAAGKSGVTRGKEKQEVDSGVDGRAAARGESCAGVRDGKQRSRGGSEEEEEEGKSKDWFGIFRKFRGLSVNLEIPTEIEIK
jgi:hypothetical protein